MPDLQSLRRQFADARFLSFDDVNGLIRLHVKTPACTATAFLQGAHLAEWQPTGQNPCIYFGRKSDLTPGKPFRGGVPIAFPWFAKDRKLDRIDGHPGPMHGFARTQPWTLEHAAMRGPDAELLFALHPTPESTSLGFPAFLVHMRMLLGATLHLELTVRNTGSAPLTFEEALHTYYAVADVHEMNVHGLENVPYIDKNDNFVVKPAEHVPLTITRPTDRVYLDTTGPYEIRDIAGRRLLRIEKTGSRSTITWNPYAAMPDLGEWEWHSFVCVETANVDRDQVTLAPAAEHTMGMKLSVHPLPR